MEDGDVIAALVPRADPHQGWLVQTLAENGSPLAEPVVVSAVEGLRHWESAGVR